jgi:probable F420-dependent oxidoreductase
VESLGYHTLLAADHFGARWPTPGPVMLTAALATTTLRVGCHVFSNDFHHPVLLAKEAAVIDTLSGGRLEFGLGAGWVKGEYERVGIPFDAPGVRVGRLMEAVRVIKGAWEGDRYTFSGQHYTIADMDAIPRPLQRPRPPIFIGAGGQRLLRFAAREADIIGLLGQALPGGGLDLVGLTEEMLAEKVGWVREAAGERFDQLELNLLSWGVLVTDDRRAAAAQLASADWLNWVQGNPTGITPEQVLASTMFHIGSIDQIVDRLLAQRERHGISYLTVFPQDTEAFAPIVARLAGK